MPNPSSVTSSTSARTATPRPSESIVAVNAAAQLPIKLTRSNFPSWRAQFDALVKGYNLSGYLDGSLPCPAPTVVANGVTSPNPHHLVWVRQDKLLLHAILASLSETVASFCNTAKTSRAAWDTLHRLYANKSMSRIMNLKEKLTTASRGNQSVAAYLKGIRQIADELALVDSPVSDDDLIIFALNGLGPQFKQVSAALRERDPPITFEELHQKLEEQEVGHPLDISSFFFGSFMGSILSLMITPFLFARRR